MNLNILPTFDSSDYSFGGLFAGILRLNPLADVVFAVVTLLCFVGEEERLCNVGQSKHVSRDRSIFDPNK